MFKLLDVEFELLALNNVAVAAAALSGAGGNRGIHAARVEHVLQSLLQLVVLVARGDLGEHVLALLLGLDLFSGGFALLLAELDTVVLQVPGAERSGIDSHNRILDESFGAHEFVVRRVVDDIDDSDLEL